MTDFRTWIRSQTGRRVTAEQIGRVLGFSRTTITRRLADDDFTADELITLARHFDVSPLLALVDFDRVTDREVWDYLETEGQLVETADEGELALELARRLNPATRAAEIDELARRRAPAPPAFDGGAGDVGSLPMVADSSPDHPEEDCEDYP